MKKALSVAALVAALGTGIAGTTLAATADTAEAPAPAASCTGPTIIDDGGAWRIDTSSIVCTIPKQTETVPVPGPTTTVTEIVPGPTVTEQVPGPTETVTVTETAAPPAPEPTSSTPVPSTSLTPTPSAGFPDESTTGVFGALTRVGSQNITARGTVLENVEVNGCITVNAADVTIRNVKVNAGSCFFGINVASGSALIERVTVDGQRNSGNDSGIRCYAACVVSGADISRTVDGMKVGPAPVTVRDSYIHDLHVANGSHNDGIQSLGTSGLTVEHNRIEVGRAANSAIILSTGSSGSLGMRNVSIRDNLLGGGGWTVYAGYRAGADVQSRVSNIQVVDNTFVRDSMGYGPLTSADWPVVTRGNVWSDGRAI